MVTEAELNELRQRKLAEIQQQAMQQEQQVAAIESQINILLSRLLSPEAKARLTNIKLVNPEKYAQVVQLLAYLAQSGQLKDKVSDEELKALLQKMSGEKRETKIKRI
ncbi:MAG: hypothetical protein JXA43_02330 [Candidatus Diapherotrites archaeon]|nr:hypothetical protein [Candidatus Diapherotrites archaeon]